MSMPGKSPLLMYLCTRSFKASMPREESLTNLPVHMLFQSVYAPGTSRSSGVYLLCTPFSLCIR